MKYKICEIAEIIDGDRGKNYPKQDELLDEGYCLFLNTGNVTKTGFSFNVNQYITKEKSDSLRKGKLERQDIVYTTRGTVGNVAYYSDTVPYKHIRINSGMVIIRPKNEIVSTEFLYQLLKSEYYRPFFKKYSTGSAQPQLPIKNLSTIELDLPVLPVQVRIASILSAYDDLIENNQKQIRLLEEAAERLYREWFVALRFPGHETTPVTDGVPEGWKKGILGDIAEDFGVNERRENRELYAYYLPIDCLPKKSFTYFEVNDVSLAESSLVAFKENDILFGAMRPYFHKVVIARDSGLTRSTCFVINARREIYWAYLVMLLFSKNTIDYATHVSVGTTMPYVRWKDFVRMPIMIPTEDVAKKFFQIFMPVSQKLAKLAEENILLSEARDRLLPKLMSGEIEV